jgi:3,4-dihydroxy-2-butanone 4-phosphate synthase
MSPATGPGTRLDAVERAIADIAAGRAVVVVDDADRENEGDIIFAASKATTALMAFTIRHTSGVICVPMPGEDLDRLQLPLMTAQNKERMRTAFTVSVDVRDGVTTGISAADRARTVRALVDSATEPYELARPGHIFPLRYAEGGVLRRPGHTEAAVDLARLAGLAPVGVLAEVVNDDGTMARLPALRAFADKHGLSVACLRIGAFRDKPADRRLLHVWLSPRDAVQLVGCCIDAPDYHFIVVYGVSNNTRNRYRNAGIEFLGYRPQDNAEDHAAGILRTPDTEDAISREFHGGPYTQMGFDGDRTRIE